MAFSKSQPLISPQLQKSISFWHGRQRMTVPSSAPLKPRENVVTTANLANSKLLKLPLELIQQILAYNFLLDQEDCNQNSTNIDAVPMQELFASFMSKFMILQHLNPYNIFNSRSPNRHPQSIIQEYALSKISTRSFIQKATELGHELQNVSPGTGLSGFDANPTWAQAVLRMLLELCKSLTKAHCDRKDKASWINIAEHRCNRKTLLAVAATCRHLYVAVQPLIYEMVEFDLNGAVGRGLRSTKSAFEAERLAIKNEKAIELNLSPEPAWRPPIGDILPRFIKSPDTASNVKSISF
jgi:hypothetical protein